MRLWWTAAVGLAVVSASVLLPAWPVLEVRADDGVLGRLPVHDSTVTIRYVHSIDGLPIEEDLLVRDGTLVAERTRIREFGAGMGQIPGDGTGHADGQWWVIDDMDRELGPELHLRVGAPTVRHRVASGDVEYHLSACHAGRRVTLRPERVSTWTHLVDRWRESELEVCP